MTPSEAKTGAASNTLANPKGQPGSGVAGGKAVAATAGMTAQVDSRLMTLAAPLHAPSAGGPSAFYSHLHEELARILVTCGEETTAIHSSQLPHADVVVPGHEVSARPCISSPSLYRFAASLTTGSAKLTR